MTNQNYNLFAQFQAQIKDTDKVFAYTPAGRSFTYGELLSLSAQMANVLVELGVKPGDRVAAQTPKCIEALMLYLGCLRCGAVYLPLNNGYTVVELEYFIGDAAPEVFVCDADTESALSTMAAKQGVNTVLTLTANGYGSLMERALTQSDHFDDYQAVADDLAAILYTSGTTGRSKGAMLTHNNMASNAVSLVEYWRYHSDDVLLHALPIFHTHGLFVATNVTLMANAAMSVHADFNVDAILDDLPRCTTMMGVPTFYIRMLISARLTTGLVAHMRLFVAGSAPLSAETHREFEQRTGHAILERYGMTETNMITSNPYDGARRPGTVGFPLPNVDVRITDKDNGSVLSQGEVGMIEVKGPNVFTGYWQMPEKTASEFRDDGYFITGDLGLIDDQGYLNIVGRDKDLIISGGYNVYPAEVEAAIDEISGVQESAVIGIPHPDFGEGVTAVVTLKAGATISEEEVKGALKDKLAKYKQPKRAIFIIEMPRNKTGKVQKVALRETYATLYQ